MLCYSHPKNLDPALSLHWMLESMAHVDLVPRSWQQMFPDTCEEVQAYKRNQRYHVEISNKLKLYLFVIRYSMAGSYSYAPEWREADPE